MKQQLAILLLFPHRGRYLCFGPTIYRLNRFNLLFLSHYLTCVWGTFISFFPLLDLFIRLYWSLLYVWREFWGCLWALWRVPFGFDVLLWEWSLFADLTASSWGYFLSLQVLSMVRVNKQRNEQTNKQLIDLWDILSGPLTVYYAVSLGLGLLPSNRLRKLACYPFLKYTICGESHVVSLLQQSC